MHSSKLARTPSTPNTKLSPTDGSLLSNPHEYRSLVGSLHYLTFTRPDLSFAVQQVCQFMSHPTDAHLIAARKFSDMLMVLWIMAFYFNLVPFPYLLSLIQIGPEIHLIDIPLLVILCILVLIQSLGVPRNKILSLVPLLSLNIEHWQPPLLNSIGFARSWRILVSIFLLLPSSGVIMFLL